jgi:uncharacterized membrane-anchored protein
MNATLVRALIAIGALLVLGGVNYSLFAKEQIKRHGDVMYLDLRPVDPRSLMQGDYMALRFAVADEIRRQHAVGEEFVSLQLNADRVARIPDRGSTGSLRVHYRMRDGLVWLGTNAYFFEEGDAARFANARYARFRVDPQTGEAVLVALCDAQLKEL